MARVARPRVLRLEEVSPASYEELREKYAALLSDYITLADHHVDVTKRYLALLEAQRASKEIRL